MEKPASARSHPGAGHRDAKASRNNAAARGRGNAGVAPPRRKMTPEERTAALRFVKAAQEDAFLYMTIEEEYTEEEYRRAGRLHVYDPDTEWMKRYARIARMYRPPDGVALNLAAYMRILEEDEQDLPIGLASCVGIFDQDY